MAYRMIKEKTTGLGSNFNPFPSCVTLNKLLSLFDDFLVYKNGEYKDGFHKVVVGIKEENVLIHLLSKSWCSACLYLRKARGPDHL